MNSIYVRTIGSVQGYVCDGLISVLGDRLQRRVKLLHDTGYPLLAFEPKRNQYYARIIIETLLQILPEDCEKMICVTDVDLCTPILTFVYGEAQLDGKIAVVSMNRLKQEFYSLPSNDKLLLQRLIKECLHELGHCYGLVHCSSKHCVMHFSSNIMNIDNKQCHYCVRCQDYFMAKTRKEEHGQE
jgi:archaemetzincin